MAKRKPEPVVVTTPVETVVDPFAFPHIFTDSRAFRWGDGGARYENLLHYFTRTGFYNAHEYRAFYLTTYCKSNGCHIVQLVDWVQKMIFAGIIDARYPESLTVRTAEGGEQTQINVIYVTLNEMGETDVCN